MKTVVSLLFLVYASLIYSNECIFTPALTEVQKLEKLVAGNDCKPLDKTTWQGDITSPCDCISKKDLFSKLNAIDKQRVYGRSFSLIENDLEQQTADSINNLLISQLEQSVRLDIYLKKGIISTEDTVADTKKTSDTIIKMPASCRINKISELINNIKSLSASGSLQCDVNKLNRRLVKIFDGKTLQKWTDDNQKMIETTVMNQISPKDKEKGMCIPYKSYLSFNSSNNLRPTYLSVVFALKDDFKGFQKWAKDRTKPDDISNVLGRNLLRDNPNFNKNGTPTDSNKKYSEMLGSVLLRSSKTPIEPITTDDITNLIKTDPLFERMISDESFFKAIVTNPKFPKISENDPEIIKKIAESQDSSCSSLYGEDLIPESTSQIIPSKTGGRKQSTKTQTSKSESYNIKNQNLLTQFLCDDNFSKDQIDSENVSALVKPLKIRSGGKLSIDDAELAVVDHLFCMKENKSSDTKIEIPIVTSIIPKPNDLFKSMLNPSLRPSPDLTQSDDNSSNTMHSNNYQKFNKSVCEYVNPKCKSDTEFTSNECSIPSISSSAITSLITKKVNTSEVLKKELNDLVFDINLSDKELRIKLAGYTQLSKEEINTLIQLRQQTPDFIRLKAKADIKYYAKDLGRNEDIDAYIARKGGLDSVFSDSSIQLPTYIKTALSNDKKIEADDSIYAESINDSKASYFSNYFALAKEEDQAVAVAASKPQSTPVVSQNRTSGSTNTDPTNSSTTVDSGTFRGSSTGTSSNEEEVKPSPSTGYKRKSFSTNVDRSLASKPEIVIETPKDTPPVKPKDDKKVSDKSDGTEDDKPKKVKNVKQDTPSFTLTSTSSNSSSSDKGFIPPEITPNKINSRNISGSNSESETKALEDRLDKLNSLADEMNKARQDTESDQASEDRRNEIEQLQDQIRKAKARNAMNTKIKNIADAANNYISDKNSNRKNDSISDNSFADNRNYANPYDPMDRGTSGKREPNATDTAKVAQQPKSESSGESSGSSNAATTTSGKPNQPGGSSASLTAGIGGLGNNSGKSGGKNKAGRYPANENGEGDPDDICGYDQSMNCIFEYNSIFNLPNRFPTLAKFVEYVQLQGRSFKAIEVYKFKNKTKPTKYFIHVFEPSKALTEGEKIKLFEEVKKLSKNFKANYKRLKFLATQVYEEKKYEITKQEAKELQPSILRFEDLNKLIDRRTREQ